MNILSVKIKNYKCFSDNLQGFDGIKPINVLIGRNNSGKSSLLDLIDYVVKPIDLDNLGHEGMKPEIYLTIPLNEEELKGVFNPSAFGGLIGINHWEYGRQLIGSNITIKIENNGNKKFSSLDSFKIPDPEYENKLAERINTPFSHKVFKRICAERDITIESDSTIDVDVDEHGKGATNIIQQFINKASLPSDLVEKTLLSELNKIFGPDTAFSDIVVQQLRNGFWEIYLEEEHKGRIALSQSGSGLKTILLILIFIFLVPIKEQIPLEKYIFALEEPENNLHAAVQRRLFLYLKDIALRNHVYFFITSHSNIAIDVFSSDFSAQIYHIENNNNEAISNPVKTYVEKAGILDDLDIRASDLLQSNGIIWVEGPSDRLYINKWIEIWSEAKLREGAHYQCVFYGGRLLSHLSAAVEDDELNDLVKILSVNRNAVILIDSDKRREADPINNTKKRISEEIERLEGFCWITEGKEIENYMPKSSIESYFKIEVDENVGPYEPFNDYLEKIKLGEGGRFLSKKVLFAEEIRSHLNKENLSTMLDLNDKMNELIIKIKKWNSIE